MLQPHFWLRPSATMKEETPEDHIAILAKLKALGFRINPHLALFSSSREKSEKRLEAAGLEGRG